MLLSGTSRLPGAGRAAERGVRRTLALWLYSQKVWSRSGSIERATSPSEVSSTALGEMDLLAVRPQPDGVVGWHVEVTVSFRPIGYIAREPAGSSGRRGSYVRKRTPEQVRAYAREWVKVKFRAPDKVRLRADLWPDARWSFHLVHGVVRYPLELKVIANEEVACHPFYELLSDLSERGDRSFSGSAGGDLAEIISYYETHETGSAEPGAAADGGGMSAFPGS
jgi:hypothetical protein